MKSVISDLFPVDSRARRRKGLVSESHETNLTHISPLHRLGKRSGQVYCPYCKQTTQTRIEQSDSKTTKGINVIFWIGMGDPFALTAHDWCQNIDHFCSNCNRHLAHKPYRGQAQTIPEDNVLELPLGYHHERIELPAYPNHVSELYGDRELNVQREAGKEAVLGPHSSESQASRILSPAELGWEVYQTSPIGHNRASVLIEACEMESPELSAGHNPNSAELLGERYQHTPELRTLNTIKRKPVELGSGRVRNTNQTVKPWTLATRRQQSTCNQYHHHESDRFNIASQGVIPFDSQPIHELESNFCTHKAERGCVSNATDLIEASTLGEGGSLIKRIKND